MTNCVSPIDFFATNFFEISLACFQFEFKRQETHRNVPCDVYSAKSQPAFGKTFIIYELFIPQDADRFRGNGAGYFSVRATSYDSDKYSPDLSTNSPYNYKMIIDFYNVDSMDGDDRRYEELQKDFSLPLGSGCSAFLQKISPFIAHQTFTMLYHQVSIPSAIFMAYDHVGGYMRKELLGKSVSIWDLSEDYLYSVVSNSTQYLHRPTVYGLRACSVLKVTSESLGPAYRPYEKVGQSLDVLKLLGAESVAYIGRGIVRELPCLVFETILEEPPSLFALSSEQLNRKASVERDYIVTYHIVESDQLGPDAPDLEHQLELLKGGFRPARITLYRRFKQTGNIEFFDGIEVSDFSSSLYGWIERPSALFMASECFDEENDQLRLEVDVNFPLVHEPGAKPTDKALLSHNKFKLETHLIGSIFNAFSMSKMHLIDYELKLKPHHVDLDMIVSDRKEAKNLVYEGRGNLPNENAYELNRAIWFDQSEESCVTLSSLLKDISMVVYCPAFYSERSKCTAVYEEYTPTYERVANVDATKPTCHVYRYEPIGPPPSALAKITQDKFNPLKEFNLEVTIPESEEKTQMLKGVLKHFDISHEIQLLVIGHYMFDLKQGDQENGQQVSSENVRYFDSLVYNQKSDCAKMCALDATCRSYSYCSQSIKTNCIVSTLDPRKSKLNDQLVQATPNANQVITVQGDDGNEEFGLKFEDECDIYERDYLSEFSRTDEVISLSLLQVTKYQTAGTTFECAKQSVDLELSYPDHQVAMFAYCSSTSSCLLDENLFESSTNDSSSSSSGLSLAQEEEDRGEFGGEFDFGASSISKEILCSVYRKKYQSYFKVSAQVLKQNSATTNQVELQTLSSIEECARACWNRFGKVCVSFDYCNPNTCLINQVGSKTDASNTEVRSKCLHYERNKKLDEVRRKHLIGRHEYLELDETSSTSTGGFWSTGFVKFLIVIVSLIVGLKLGVLIDNKMSSVRILTQSISNGPGIRSSSQMFAYQNGANLGLSSDDNGASYAGLNGRSLMNEDDDFRDAIRMDVIGSKSNDQDDDSPLQKDF